MQPLLKEIFRSHSDPELSDLHYLITANFNDESTLIYLTSKIDRIIYSLKNTSSLNLSSSSSYSVPSFSSNLETQDSFSTSSIPILPEVPLEFVNLVDDQQLSLPREPSEAPSTSFGSFSGNERSIIPSNYNLSQHTTCAVGEEGSSSRMSQYSTHLTGEEGNNDVSSTSVMSSLPGAPSGAPQTPFGSFAENESPIPSDYSSRSYTTYRIGENNRNLFGAFSDPSVFVNPEPSPFASSTPESTSAFPNTKTGTIAPEGYFIELSSEHKQINQNNEII